MKKFPKYVVLLVLVIVFSVTLFACVVPPNISGAIPIDLNDLEPLSIPVDTGILPLKVAIAAVISPIGTAESYAPLLAYLESELGRPIELVQRRTYAEINDLVETGFVDLAFVCTSAYIAGKDDFNMQLLVAPKVNGEPYYRSILIVPAESLATSMLDLRGKVFAFTDPMSFSGRMYPTYLLYQLGESPNEFFQRTFFTYSHDDAIRAVADGLADGAAVDSLVLDFALDRDSELRKQLKIINTSEPFGIPPVVVSPLIRPQLRVELEEILLNMHRQPTGKSALEALDIDEFILVSDDLYSSVELVRDSIANELDLP